MIEINLTPKKPVIGLDISERVKDVTINIEQEVSVPDVYISSKKPGIDVDFSGASRKDIQVNGRQTYPVYPYSTYEGPTTVTSLISEMQILETEKTMVMENIFVLPIPISETHNEHGGLTVVIG